MWRRRLRKVIHSITMIWTEIEILIEYATNGQHESLQKCCRETKIQVEFLLNLNERNVWEITEVSQVIVFFLPQNEEFVKTLLQVFFFFHLTCYDQSSVWFMWRILLWDWFAAVVHIMETSAVVITFCNSVKRMKWSITLKNKQECREGQMCLYSTF